MPDWLKWCISDTTADITTIDQIAGDWWILKGQNCGQDETWNGAYDAFPCQLQSFVKSENGWVRNTTFCFGEDNACRSQMINVAPLATVETPGVIKTLYTNPLYLQMEERYVLRILQGQNHEMAKACLYFQMVHCGADWKWLDVLLLVLWKSSRGWRRSRCFRKSQVFYLL